MRAYRECLRTNSEIFNSDKLNKIDFVKSRDNSKNFQQFFDFFLETQVCNNKKKIFIFLKPMNEILNLKT